MKRKSIDNVFAIRLMPGDDIHKAVQSVCAEHGIKAATLHAIGSVDSPTLAHYRLDTKDFVQKQFAGIFEIVSMTGNVALIDNKPAAHIHCVISDEAMQAHGGHLVQGNCSALVELFLRPLKGELRKTHDDSIGLNAWDF